MASYPHPFCSHSTEEAECTSITDSLTYVPHKGEQGRRFEDCMQLGNDDAYHSCFLHQPAGAQKADPML
jgi:hypothetical protein